MLNGFQAYREFLCFCFFTMAGLDGAKFVFVSDFKDFCLTLSW